MKYIFQLTLLFLLCFSFSTFAEVPKQLINDFSTIDGTIIMPIGDNYLVDLDASNGLHEGDILTLLMSGEKIIQPDTKKIIATVSRPKGFLQVTQVKSGYAYATMLSQGVTAQKGDKLKRFEQVPAKFITTQPTGKLEEELKRALPQLNWTSDADDSSEKISFILAKNILKVTDSSDKELKSYRYQDGKLTGLVNGGYQANSFQLNGAPDTKKSLLNQAISRVTTTIGVGGRDKRLENPGITQEQKLDNGIWTSSSLGGNPVGITVGDFDADGQLETAIAMEDHLQILRMGNGALKRLTVINFAAGVHLLSLDSCDVDNNGSPELYISANVGTKISSQVVEYKDGQYRNTINRIPWLLRVVNLPEKGKTLLAQELNPPEAPFSLQPFRVLLTQGRLVKSELLPLPQAANMLSFAPLKGTNNDLLYAYISPGEYLHVITPGGAAIWESVDKFGGSEIFFNLYAGDDKKMSEPIFIQPRLVTLPTGEVLAAKNEGLRVLKRYHKFSKSRIIALKWEGTMLRESWATRPLEGYLADFTVADADNDGQDELVMVINYKQKNLLQKGRSAVVIYELNQ